MRSGGWMTIRSPSGYERSKMSVLFGPTPGKDQRLLSHRQTADLVVPGVDVVEDHLGVRVPVPVQAGT